MKRIYLAVLILISFAAFLVFDFNRRSSLNVIKIINASKIAVDLNNNGKQDADEVVCIPDVKVFTSNLFDNQQDLSKIVGISNIEALKLGYLTDIFAENELADKKVKVKLFGRKNSDCNYGDIFVNNESYMSRLFVSGYGFFNNNKSDKFEERLNQAKKLDLVILNHRSNKYHKLDCEFGKVAHDASIIPRSQVPSDSAKCKYCHVDVKETPQQINYPLILSKGVIKMYLADSSVKLRPDGNCNFPACSEIVKKINSTKESIDIAMYGWDSVQPVYKALEKAKNRGVKIRVVYDVSESNYYPKTSEILNLAAEYKFDTKKGLMHNKFMIFDDNSIVTGSMNFSKTGLSGFNTNTIFFIDSKEIAQIYKSEFNQMILGSFQKQKNNVKHNTVIIGDTKITPLFSPKDKIIENYLINYINNSKDYIYIPAFIITHEKFSNALISANKRGVKVKVIVDATHTSSAKSKIKNLRNSGVSLKVENFAGKVHSKSIIIDDKYVISGSMNFTNSGENANDENLLIIEDEKLAKYYKGFFEYLWNKIPEKYLKINPKPEGKDSPGSCNKRCAFKL